MKLYVISESGLHRYSKRLEHHLDHLGMQHTQADLCMPVKSNGKDLQGMIVLEVDFLLGFGTLSFMRDDKDATARFK